MTRPAPTVTVPPKALEAIAFNLCSLHDFDPAFVQQNERFAIAAITEYLRATPAPAAPQASGVGEREGLIMALNIVTDPGIITGLRTAEEARSWIERSLQSALRARSSAPEDREEALGNLLAVIHGDGGHRALEVGTKQAALEAEKIVAGLFAAPSADKLREVVEGFVSDLTGSLKNRSTMLTINHNALTARIDQALAALKAEGC